MKKYRVQSLCFFNIGKELLHLEKNRDKCYIFRYNGNNKRVIKMLEKITETEFNEFAQVHPHNIFFQSSYWGHLKEFTGWKSHLLGYKENGILVAATLFLSKQLPVIQKSMFYAPRGFLIDYENQQLVKNFVDKIKVYVKQQGGIFFKINPYLMYQERDVDGNIVEHGIEHKDVVTYLKHLGFVHNGLTVTYGIDLEPRWISVLDLEGKDEESLLAEMRPTTRLGIRSSYKHGLILTEIDETRISEYKALMEHTCERRGFLDRSLEYYQKMYESFHPTDDIKIMLVELDVEHYLNELNNAKIELLEKMEPLKESSGAKAKRQCKEYVTQLQQHEKRIQELEQIKAEKGSKIVLAGGVFMTYGTQVVSLFGASYREYMKFNGQYFLNFEMIKYALQHGYKKYNFFGITGEFNEDSPMYGLFDFKRGFHAKVVELIGEFNYIVSPGWYRIYQTMFFVYRKLKKGGLK